MAVMMLRLLIVWVLLTFMIRLMGKRQIGELQMSEMVTAFLLSELAATPVMDTGIPLLYSVVPMLLLSVTEILSSCLFLRFKALRRLAAGSPVLLIRRGEIDQAALRDIRMSISELLSELRQKGAADPAEVSYAVLEENGQLSVLMQQKQEASSGNSGFCHTLIADGEFSAAGLRLSGYTEAQVRRVLSSQSGLAPEAVFLMTVNDSCVFRIVPREQSAVRLNGHRHGKRG